VSLTHRHLFACCLLGCTSQPNDGSTSQDTLPGNPGDPDAPASGPDGEVEGQPAEPPAIALTRGLGHEATLTEVWLDTRASAALTLDALGDVRLWPTLPTQGSATEAAALDKLAPIRVPFREPLWLSFARTGERSFVVAAIDTAQAARVLEIDLDEAGNATFRERFTIPPRDPLLELHVLDQGERLLALGVDHRIRLYNRSGKLLSELTEYGLAPWQLRIVGPPEAPQLAMVLAGPTRLQRFTITDDRLAKHGEARAFTLDRGPNGNDLALLPSGRVAAVLRRPEQKGLQWSLELHDLDSGEIRVLWGEIEAKWRPRLHIIDEEHALLEDGIAGYWVDLRQAVVMPAMPAGVAFELPEKLEELPPESHVTVRRVPLPGTSQTVRRHTSVVAGLRVVPVGRALLLDPVPSTPPAGGERHHRLGHRAVSIRGLDFDGAGELLAIDYDKKIVIENTTTGSAQPGGCASENLIRFAFTDPDHILLLGTNQAQICAWRTGQMVATIELPAPPDMPDSPNIERAILHPTGPGTGEIGLRRSAWIDDGNKLDLTHTSYANNQFGALEPLAKSDRSSWPELEDKWQVAVVDAVGNRYLANERNTRKLEITLASGETRDLALVEAGATEIDIWRIEPSRDGRFLAIVTTDGDSDGYGHGYYGGYSGYGYNITDTLSIWATASEPPELLWSTIVSSSSIDLAWTDDGSRLAMEDNGRLRVLTNRGEVLLDRGVRDFQLEELPDDPSATAPTDTNTPSPAAP
jgi:hypothetical protein